MSDSDTWEVRKLDEPIYFDEKKVVPENVARELEMRIIRYSRKNGLTAAIVESVARNVMDYMKDNAVLQQDDNLIPSCQES